MRILAITPTFFPVMGGAETGIYEIYRRLALWHEVRILTPEPPATYEKDFGMEEPIPDLSGLDVVRFRDRINLKNWRGHGRLKGLIPPFSFSLVKPALRAVKDFRPDVVNVFYALPSGLAASRIMKTKEAPVVLCLVGRDIPGPGIPRFWGAYARWASRRASKVIFISEYCRQALCGPRSAAGGVNSEGEPLRVPPSDARPISSASLPPLLGRGMNPRPATEGSHPLGSPDDRLPASRRGAYSPVVIPFGADTERYRPGLDGSAIRAKLGIPAKARVLFNVQRLDRWKRVDVVLEAMKIVLGEADAYLIIGGKGPELDGLRRLAADLGIASRVFFAGYIKEEELPLHFAMADLFVFHSIYETFGLVLVQAMAAGKPVVSVRSTAIPEVIEDGREGRLVAPLDPRALAQAILSLLGDEAARARFSAAARRSAVERFSWDAIARRYEEALAGMIK